MLSVSSIRRITSSRHGFVQIPASKLGLEERARMLKFHLSDAYLEKNPSSSLKISCGLRGGPRKPLWRGRVLSSEAIQAVQSLKLAKSASKLEEVFDRRISRLIKEDLIATLVELQRQNEWEIALKVFDFLRKETWYRPDLSLYCQMIFVMGKNKLIGKVEELFSELRKEGLKPDTRVYTEMIGAFLKVGMVEKAMDTYRFMKETGCDPDKVTLTILMRNLEEGGQEQYLSTVTMDCMKYIEYPEKFIEEAKKKHKSRRV